MVADELLTLLLSGNFVEEPIDLILEGVDREANLALYHEVHLCDLLILFIYDIVRLVLTIEESGEEAHGHVIAELGVRIYVRLEEPRVRMENVAE